MIASDLAQRYGEGAGLKLLSVEFRMSPRAVAKTLRAMGVVIRPAGFNAERTRAGVLGSERKAHEKRMATGAFCKRCEILLEFDPGRDGWCGECLEEAQDVTAGVGLAGPCAADGYTKSLVAAARQGRGW